MESIPIEKITIPDSDALGWIETLRQGGFSQGEIEGIMSHLNKTYREKINPKENRIDEELKRIEDHLFLQYGQKTTPERREYLRKAISEREEFRD